MKRAMVLLLVLTATGCIELPIRPDHDAAFMKSSKTSDLKAPAPPPMRDVPVVTPEQVNDGNAAQTLDALRKELDHAANERAVEPKP